MNIQPVFLGYMQPLLTRSPAKTLLAELIQPTALSLVLVHFASLKKQYHY